MGGDQVRKHLTKLNLDESIGLDGIHSQIQRKLKDITERPVSMGFWKIAIGFMWTGRKLVSPHLQELDRASKELQKSKRCFDPC